MKRDARESDKRGGAGVIRPLTCGGDDLFTDLQALSARARASVTAQEVDLFYPTEKTRSFSARGAHAGCGPEKRASASASLALAMLLIATFALIAASPTPVAFDVEATGRAPACPEASWVSFSPAAPYDPAVADVAAVVWLPNLLFPCPSLFLGVGHASLQGPLPQNGSATGVALGHSIFIACCGLPLASTIIGAPLVALETMWVAPVSVLNALDRDVRCARGERATMPAPSTPTPKAPAARSGRAPGPSRTDPLPPPLPPPEAEPTTPAPSRTPTAMLY